MPGTFRVRAREKYAPSKLLITFTHPNELSVGVSEVLGCAGYQVSPWRLSKLCRVHCHLPGDALNLSPHNYANESSAKVFQLFL